MRRQNILQILYYELVVNFCIFLDNDTMEKTKNPFPKSKVPQL